MNDNARVHSLIEAGDSVLIVIDLQASFLEKLPAGDGDQIAGRASWLVRVAHWLHIPLVVTSEGGPDQPLAPKLVSCLPPDTPVYDKRVFGLAHQPDILDAVKRSGRKTAVLVGLETDVCVLHSAIGLLEAGYRVAVVVDATGTPAPGHEIALDRLRDAGTTLLHTKGLFYEWVRTLEATHRFRIENPDLQSFEGIAL